VWPKSQLAPGVRHSTQRAKLNTKSDSPGGTTKLQAAVPPKRPSAGSPKRLTWRSASVMPKKLFWKLPSPQNSVVMDEPLMPLPLLAKARPVLLATPMCT
jgi:hypothetical protein